MQTQVEVVCCLLSALPVVTKLWEAVCTVVQNILDHLQQILTVPQFLVCTKALLQEQDIEPTVWKQTLVALSNCLTYVNLLEMLLFLKMIPNIIEIVTVREGGAEE